MRKISSRKKEFSLLFYVSIIRLCSLREGDNNKMTVDELDTLLQKLAKIGYESYDLSYNPQEDMSVEEYLLSFENDEDGIWFEFIDDKERQQCEEKNTLWIFSWVFNDSIKTKNSGFSLAASELGLIFDHIRKGIRYDS